VSRQSTRLNVRRDRDRQSAAAARAANRPIDWRGREGWADLNIRRSRLHYMRHGHSLCGAHEWRPGWGEPELERDPKSFGAYRRTCRRCKERLELHQGRALTRDHPWHQR